MQTWVWASMLLGIGGLLVLLEFFIPSAGIIGIIAAICLISAIVIGYLDSVVTGTLILAIEVIGLPVVLAAMVRVWPHTPIGRKLFLRPPAESDVSVNREQEGQLQALVGRRGVAKSAMMPSGIVKIDRQTFDAVAEGESVEPGGEIVVRAVRMNRLIVRKVRPDFIPPNSTESADLLSRSIEELGLEGIDDDEAASPATIPNPAP